LTAKISYVELARANVSTGFSSLHRREETLRPLHAVLNPNCVFFQLVKEPNWLAGKHTHQTHILVVRTVFGLAPPLANCPAASSRVLTNLEGCATLISTLGRQLSLSVLITLPARSYTITTTAKQYFQFLNFYLN
jgi:hypothetical protein